MRRMKINDALLLALLLAVGFASSIFVNHEGDLFAFRRIAYYAAVFYIGILMDGIELKKANILTAILTVISVTLTGIFWDSGKEIYHIPIVNLITAIGFSLIIVIVFQKISDNVDLKLIPYIGKYSLDVYLLHIFFAAGGRMIINKLSGISVWICVPGLFIIALFLPLLAGIISRRIGVYDLFFKPYAFFVNLKKIG